MPGTAVQNKAKYGNSTFQQVIDTEYTGDKERGYFSDWTLTQQVLITVKGFTILHCSRT